MQTNFDKLTQRLGTNSYKWDEPEDNEVIPMWVADMDFEVAEPIIEALHERIDHRVFGYTMVPKSYYDAIQHWYERRHQWHIEREWVIYTSGVVPAVSAIIKALTLPSEEVLIMTPAYNCFYSSIRNNGCTPLECALKNNNGHWVIDFEEFEAMASRERVNVFILCNPHNPVGRVWTPDELRRIGEICRRHNVTVVADEIHNEIVMPGYKYTPFASLSDDCLMTSVTCCSPTKGFNFAGLQIANIICADAHMRYRIDRAINLNECCDVNPFGVIALQKAYNECEPWLMEMTQYVWQNYQTLCDFLHHHLPQLHVSPLEGTYLAWIDIRDTGMSSDEFTDMLLREAKVMLSSGTTYSERDGEGYVRMNLACPRRRLEEALTRIKKVIK